MLVLGPFIIRTFGWEKFISHCFVKIFLSLYDSDIGHEQKKKYGIVGYGRISMPVNLNQFNYLIPSYSPSIT